MSKYQNSDRTLYCERCGISFIWSREEQVESSDEAAPADRPTLCPGCLRLLPRSGRARGLVKWFNHQKRYGFLSRSEKPDLFVHRSSLPRNTRLRPGDLVEFIVTEGKRGPAAGDVSLLARASDSGRRLDVDDR